MNTMSVQDWYRRGEEARAEECAGNVMASESPDLAGNLAAYFAEDLEMFCEDLEDLEAAQAALVQGYLNCPLWW